MVQQKLVSSVKIKNDDVNQDKMPKLRFSFDGKYFSDKLDDLKDYLSSGKTNVNQNNVPDGKFPIYGSQGVIGYMKNYDYDGDYILIARVGANAGNLSRIYGKCGITDNTLILKNNERLDKNYLFYYLEKYNLNKLVFGSGQPLITGKQLKNINIIYPSLLEQQKIANFLENIDKKIELLEKKLVLYQKNIDFNINKIFSNINDFNEVRLKNIVKSYSSNLSINKLEENQGDYPLYGAEGIVKYVDFYEIETPYISIIKDGAGVGRLNLCEKLSSPLGTLQCLIPNDDIDINFLYFYLKTINFRKYIVGSTIPHIYYKDYSNEKINVPSLKNQQNIGNYFILLDKRNELIKREIKLLNKFKKGLLQKMFV